MERLGKGSWLWAELESTKQAKTIYSCVCLVKQNQEGLMKA